MTYVAVYGSLKKGFHNHYYLRNSEYVGSSTVGGFDMYSHGPYPMIVHGAAKKRVHVEVYEVDENTMNRLDCLEGYPSFYDRCIRHISIDGVLYPCWIYFGTLDQVNRKNLVADGNWKEPTFA